MNTQNVFIYTANTDSKHFHGELLLSKNGSGIPEGFESFAAAAKNLGRRDILKAWTIGSEDDDKNSGGILNMSCKIIDEPEVFSEYYRRAFMEHARDWLQRLEVIITPPDITGEKLQTMLEAYKSVQKEYPDFTVKFIVNTGENETPEDNTVIDSYILGTKRIKYEFNYPELETKLIDGKIALEVCPISSQVLDHISDLREHPAQNYLKRGVPVVICPDYQFMLWTAGSTYDFYAVVLAWDLGLSDIKHIKQLCINSIEYSGGTDEERQEIKAIRQKSWDEFIKRWSEPSGLDPISELYFYETDKSKIVPVEKLRIIEKVTPESVARAEKNMQRVLTGEISKRKPLTAALRNDGKGTYCVFDGNNTYSAMIKRGVKNIPVVEVPASYSERCNDY